MLKRLQRFYGLFNFYISPQKYVVRKTIRDFFFNLSAESILLDLGAGNSLMGEVVNDACKSKQYIASEIAPTDETTLICDAQKLPFSGNTVDVVAAFELIEHIPDTYLFLSEIERVLKPNGYLILSMPFLYGHHDFQDYYRWTTMGLQQSLFSNNFDLLVTRKQGGVFLTIITLLILYLYSIFSSKNDAWRASNNKRKFYFVILTAIVLPLRILSWLALALDSLIDSDSANPSGFVCIAQKKL